MDRVAAVTLVEAAVAVALVEFTDRIGDIVQFRDDRVLHFAETDNQADHQQRGDENEFRADEEARFIRQELLKYGDIPSFCKQET